VPGIRTDLYVLGAIADEMDVHLGLPDAAAARAELRALGPWKGAHPAATRGVLRTRDDHRRRVAGSSAGSSLRAGVDVRLATGPSSWTRAGCRTASRTWPAPRGPPWREPPLLRGRGRRSRRRQGDRGDHSRLGNGSPLDVTNMADGVVWLPANSSGAAVRADLGAGHGSRVTLRRAELKMTPCACVDSTLSDFNQLIWWMVLLKVAIVFVFLLLTTIFMIWFERRGDRPE